MKSKWIFSIFFMLSFFNIYAKEEMSTIASNPNSGVVLEIISANELIFQDDSDKILSERTAHVFNNKNNQYIANIYISEKLQGNKYHARLIGFPTGLISPGDLVVLDENLHNLDLVQPSSFFLFQNERKKTLKYQPLFFIPTTELYPSLGKNNFFADSYGIISYGLTDQIDMNFNLVRTMMGVKNFNFKYSFQPFKYFSFAQSAGFHFLDEKKNFNLEFSSIFEIPSNDRFISYFLIKNTFINQIIDRSAQYLPEQYSMNTGKIGNSITIKSITEMILDNWDRILMGPSFDFQNKAVGVYFGGVHFYGPFQFYTYLIFPDLSTINKFAIFPGASVVF